MGLAFKGLKKVVFPGKMLKLEVDCGIKHVLWYQRSTNNLWKKGTKKISSKYKFLISKFDQISEKLSISTGIY